jgi:predicted nuclease of predicted toxin-antitoxin system
MNFVADESVDQPIVTRLREEGHTVLAIVEMEPSISDEVMLEIANQQGMVLLTGDKDFGELVFRDRRYAFGIVLIRLSGLTAMGKAEIVVSAVKEHGDKLVEAFAVISANNVRIRSRLL